MRFDWFYQHQILFMAPFNLPHNFAVIRQSPTPSSLLGMLLLAYTYPPLINYHFLLISLEITVFHFCFKELSSC